VDQKKSKSILACFTLALALLAVTFTSAAGNPVISRENVPMARGYERVTVVDGLEHPWAMTWLPNGSIIVTERPGRVRLIRGDAMEPEPLSGVPEVLNSGQGGLLDVSLHPRFEENRLVYFTYAKGSSLANRTCLARARLEGMALQGWQVLFEVSQAKIGTQHFGARILWLPDATMLISIGDGGNPPISLEGALIRRQAQNKASHLGKILRLNDDGTIPKDNPFFGAKDAVSEVWSLGHRNIQGLTWDSIRSKVWASEHGALGGDELNTPSAGENYGWPVVTFSREYFLNLKISDAVSAPGMVDPIMVWSPAIAPSGLLLYTGDKYRDWHGDLFVGGLVSQDVRRIDLDKEGYVRGEEALRIGARVRDVRQGPDGLLYVLTDEDSGRLIRLEPRPGGGETAP
jgi:glucose/arabinose dehydrogenase